MPNELYPARDPVARAREIMLGAERVRVVEAGDEGQFPIVLFHGWGASAYNFRGVLGPLAAAGYRVIAPDLRGHGGSDTRLPRGAWSRESMVEWVEKLLDALGVDECVMAGQSIGAALALDAAAFMPARVRAVVALTPVGFTTIKRVRLARWFPWVTFPTTPRWIVAAVLRDVYGTRGEWTQQDLNEYWIPLRRGDVVRGVLQSAREFDFTLRDPAPLKACHVVIRFGELDRVIPRALALRHASRFVGADVAVLPGVGHVPADEVPNEIVELLRRTTALVVEGQSLEARG